MRKVGEKGEEMNEEKRKDIKGMKERSKEKENKRVERFQNRDYKIKSELEKEKAIECAVKR